MESRIKYTTYNEPFRRYVESMVKKRGCTYQELLDGLCTEKEWNEYCYEDRLMGLLLTERIMERLGGHIGNYEYLVFSDEYDRWEKRMKIVFSIEDGEPDRARGMLEAYQAGKDKLERQFCLMMKAQLMKCKGEKTGLASVYKEAAKLTIPDGVDAKLDKCILSVQEVNILLEYYYLRAYMQGTYNKEFRKCIDRVEDIIRYINNSKWDDVLIAKVYAKATCYLIYLEDNFSNSFESVHNYHNGISSNLDGMFDRLEKCNAAIEILKKKGRSYYLAELFDIMADTQKKIQSKLTSDFPEKSGYEEQVKYTQKWQEILKYKEKLTGVCRYMKTDTYLYVELSIVRLEEAVASRRKMMGMSQADLAAGICDTKTIGRFERGERTTRGYIIYDILRKVKLYSDLVLGDIIACSGDEYEKIQKINELITIGKYDDAKAELDCLKSGLDMSYERNRQTVWKYENILNQEKGLITKTEYLDTIKEILGCTVDYHTALNGNGGYLTTDEVMLIQNIAAITKGEEMQFLSSLCDRYEHIRPELYMSQYELFASMIASNEGNKGNFQKSDERFMRVLKANEKLRRLKYIARCLYGLWWNANERHMLNDEDRKYLLNICVDVCRFAGENNILQHILRKYPNEFE